MLQESNPATECINLSWLTLGFKHPSKLGAVALPQKTLMLRNWMMGVANVRRFAPELACLPRYITPSERGAGFAEVASLVLAARHAVP